ncbi:MAG TPA: phosphoenolpyruvate synthase [Thermoanaerobaculia bacterium]
MDFIRTFDTLSLSDVALVGGKNASLGEMTRELGHSGIRVPAGFATTADAYRAFVDANGLAAVIRTEIDRLRSGEVTLARAGRAIRKRFLRAEIPEGLAAAIVSAYQALSAGDDLDVAVRSSATAEDLPEASFAGQHETFLNVRGEDDLLDACRRCFASLFTDRAIFYREEKQFDHLRVALSIGVQAMVRSDLACAGVAFTLDPDSGFPRVVVINAGLGLGETVVKGEITPDQYMVFKPLLDQPELRPIIQKSRGDKALKLVYARGGTHATRIVSATAQERDSFALDDDEILQLARWSAAIETHYRKPMDIEWAKDGRSGELFIVQARPETVQARRSAHAMVTYQLGESGRTIVEGMAIGEAIAAGKVSRVLDVDRISEVEEGSILVTRMTDPDWVPAMRRVAGIVTDAGGRTCHSAIIARELGIPAVVGTGNATDLLRDGDEVTISCAEGERGRVYEGVLPFEMTETTVDEITPTRTAVMMNIGMPDAALRCWRLPARGIGLARLEFIISEAIRIHPMALVRFDELRDHDTRKEIERLTRGYEDKTRYFVDELALAIGKIAASQYPQPVIVRTSDFKSNEYANLIGGRELEPPEANPMLGLRGASRYYSPLYREGFALECLALRRVREVMGFTNVIVMIPFCRTPDEADRVLATMASFGLRRGDHGLQVNVMCEIPSNVILTEEFARRFDGFSIGSNDLTQLILGVDRDSQLLTYLFDERSEAVKQMIRQVFTRAHASGRKIGICGQAPSDYPEFAAFLVDCGIDSISLNPDTVIDTRRTIAEAETRLAAVGAA